MAQIPYEIPLSPMAQKFGITLAGVAYNLTVSWNNASTGGWVLDIADSNDVPIVSGIPLVTGCDLLEQYEYLNLGGKLEVQTDSDLFAVPTFSNLGVQGHLYFLTDDGT